MKKVYQLLLLAALFCVVSPAAAQHKTDAEWLQLIKKDYRQFAREFTADSPTDFAKTQKVVHWLVQHFEWKATDYQKRTVEQIIARGGGNCAELASITKAMLKELQVQQRTVQEINLHKESEQRQENARQLVQEKGNRGSVFGRQHNDHVWLEVYDVTTKQWQPVDPSLGLVGLQDWLKSRVLFEERQLLDPTGHDMIVPMAIFVLGPGGELLEDRTQHYLVQAFNQYYGQRLQTLPEWETWQSSLASLGPKCYQAFAGKTNLHQYGQEIAQLGQVYQKLKVSYNSKK
ncbi:transglutaminase-like domain-containing protein [Rufibacter psychrotolerans]|uniref:transglutaminase-like domain-containing protein n=1 Tax=Rufibacter psychrotolerans TaxID=2812556 RepID=UPI00196860B2|nr:transglutaminase-like domain-containing protein [Rufibacter sp. SYSU D00308]